MSPNLKTSEALAIIKMGELTLLDAMIFQEVLARSELKVPTLASLLGRISLKGVFAQAWEDILTINFVPIFQVALELVKAIPASPGVEKALEILAVEAQKIASSRALLRHDLMGRIYHRLLMKDIAKYHATYYTSVAAAYLLARFSLDNPNDAWQVAWEEPAGLGNFKVADLACGSGTLLSAAYSAILDKHVITSATKDLDANPAELHRILLEKILHGFDVLSFAAHLSAVTLALHNPTSIFSNTKIYSLPLTGKGDKPRLGSIDFLESSEINPSYLASPSALAGQTIAPEQKTIEASQSSALKLEPNDLVIMNPPFTRSVVGNLLFGALPSEERDILQPYLQKLLKEKGYAGIGQAGLGAIFTAVADKFLKQGGRLALVIPRSLMSGVSWRKIRELLTKDYEIELIVTSHQAPNDWNFSENTNLSEILLVARKLSHDEEPKRGIIANLWRKPANEMESIALSKTLVGLSRTLASHTSHYDLLESANASHYDLNLGGKKLGEAYAVTQDAFSNALDNWGQLAPFAQSYLNRIAYLFSATSHFPVIQSLLPTKPLAELSENVGPDIAQVRNAFGISNTPTPFQALWNHNSSQIYKIKQHPNKYLHPKAGINVPAERLWSQGAGKLHIANRLRLNTHKVSSVFLEVDALSSMWWPIRLLQGTTNNGHTVPKNQHELLQCLWLNTTFGFLGILTYRQDTAGAWIQLKKESISHIPLLDISPLSHDQVNAILKLCSAASEQELPPFPAQFQQATQRAGWRYQVDQALLKIIFGQGRDLVQLYEMLAREPILCLKPLV